MPTTPMSTSSTLGTAGECGGSEPVGALGRDDAGRLAHVLRAVADPARLRLLSLVAASAGGETCICDLTGPVALSQPTVSHHMRVLVDVGLLTREQRGRWAYYRLVDAAVADLVADLLAAVRPPPPASP